MGFLSWYGGGCWFRQGKSISPLYHAVFYTNKITTLGMNRLFCFSQVPLSCVDPMQLSVHYFITIVLVYLSFSFASTCLILVGDGFPSLFTISWVTYCQLVRSSLAHAWHVTWQIGIWISSWYSYSILDSLDSPSFITR